MKWERGTFQGRLGFPKEGLQRMDLSQRDDVVLVGDSTVCGRGGCEGRTEHAAGGRQEPVVSVSVRQREWTPKRSG